MDLAEDIPMLNLAPSEAKLVQDPPMASEDANEEVREVKEVNEIKEVDELRLEIVEIAEDKSELSIAIIPELYYKNKMPYDICEK